MTATPRPLRVGMVGYAFMGAAHSQAWRTAGRVFDLPLRPASTVSSGCRGRSKKWGAVRHACECAAPMNE